MKPEIQISQLKTLIAISEEGSFSAASERVGRSQSAVTQQMQSLEEIIGAPLFFAKGRRRELTEAGNILLRHGYEIISLCKQAVSASERSLINGVIRIGAPLEIAEELLPNVLKNFTKAWPGIRLMTYVERSPLLMTMLEEGQLDLAISTRRRGAHEGKLLTNMPVHWITSEDWQRNPKDPLPLVVTDEPSIFRRIALSALDLNGLPYVEKFISSSMIGVRLAVISGLGVTARTKSSFDTNVKILDATHGLPPLPNIRYYLHSSTQKMNTESIDLYKIIIDCCKKL